MDNYRFPRGSEWHKWDLHAHTPLDSDWLPRPSLSTVAEKQQFAQQYVEAAVRAGLAVVAITDHNFCRSPEELLIPYIQEAATHSGLTILPGFEVAVSDCGGTHVLVIFSEDSSLGTIDRIVSQLFPPGKERFKGSDVSSSEIGIVQLDEVLKQSKLKYLLVFAHADREDGVLSQKSSLRSELWKRSFVRIAQLSKDPSECTGFIANVISGQDKNYSRGNITCIVASDGRCLEQSEAAPGRFALGQRYTWIKATPTFEGLRQIIFEPEDRVCFQEHKPGEKPAYLVIDQVRFLDSSGTFQTDPIPLNPNLTTIIGGKSTGKSILLTHIARAINHEYAQKAINIAKTNVYDFGNLDFEVVWKSGDIDKLSENTGQRHVTFLPQMFIHSLVENENRSYLSEYLLSFLRQNASFEARYCELVDKRNGITTALTTEVSSFFSHLSTRQDIVNKMEKLGNRTSIEAELQKIAKDSEALSESSGFTDEENKKYKEAQRELAELTARYEANQRVQACFQELGKRIPALIKDTMLRFDEVVEEVAASYGLEGPEVALGKSHMTRLKEAIKAANEDFVRENSRFVQNVSRQLKAAIAGLSDTKSKLKVFLDKISNQKKLEELQEATKQSTLLLKQISAHERAKLKVEKKYHRSVRRIEGFITERYSIQKKIIELFNDPTYTEIGDDIVVIANLAFDKDRFNNDFLGCFDRRYDIRRLGGFFRDNGIVWSEDKHVEAISSIFHKLIETSAAALIFRSGQTLQSAVEMLLRDYLSHEFTVKQAGEDIFRMSPGKQGLILLEIYLYLSDSAYPILIDQPEDNLDNRTVYSHLVDYIRRRKEYRQIIIVTHNPNIVLGPDAEQIIVANQDGQGRGRNARYRFEYASGPIECSFTDSKILSVLGAQGIREHVCEVLEGGKDAFRKREEKYGLG
jgi:hypothetical protein